MHQSVFLRTIAAFPRLAVCEYSFGKKSTLLHQNLLAKILVCDFVHQSASFANKCSFRPGSLYVNTASGKNQRFFIKICSLKFQIEICASVENFFKIHSLKSHILPKTGYFTIRKHYFTIYCANYFTFCLRQNISFFLFCTVKQEILKKLIRSLKRADNCQKDRNGNQILHFNQN